MLVDSHCHLDFEWFDEDRNGVINNAIKEGVIYIVNPGIDLKSSYNAVKLASNYPVVFAAVGIHPNEANSWQDDSISKLKKLANSKKVVAIGEIGLDYYRDRSPVELQKRILEKQLQLATEMDLPVILHTRNKSKDDAAATEDAIKILEMWTSTLRKKGSKTIKHPGVLHSYGGNIEHARRAVAMGFYIGVTGPITYKNADDLRNMVLQLPINRLLVETDAPFLTPHPFRGKRNEPKYVKFVAEKLAELYDVSIEKITENTTRNAESLFNWKMRI